MKILPIILILILNLIQIAGAQKIWTLDDCINYAKDNNLNIKQQNLNVQSAEYDKIHSYGNMLPSINGFVSHTYDFGLTVDRFTNEFANAEVLADNFYLTASLTLFNGLQNENSVKKSKIDIMSNKYDSDKLINDISLNIASGYMQILYNDEILKTTVAQLEITKQQVERNKKMYDAGTIAKGNLLSIEAQAASDELQVVNAKNALDLSYITLKLLLDLQANEVFEIEKPNIEITGEEILKQKPEDIYATALGTQPDVKSAELKVKSMNLALSINKGMNSPQLSIQVNIGTGYSSAGQSLKGINTTLDTIGYVATEPHSAVVTPYPNVELEKTSFMTQLNQNVNKTIGLNLTIPILNGLQTYTAINKSRIAIKNAEYSLQIIKNNLNKSIQQAYADATAAYNKYYATKKSLDALEESYKYSEEKYNVGMLDFVDYNDSKSKLTKAQSDSLQAKYDYIYKIKVLDFYQGKQISFN